MSLSTESFIPGLAPSRSEDDEMIQFFGGAGNVEGAEVAAAAGARSHQSDLPYRSQLESSFGVNLGHIRAHSGSTASKACDAVGADAYATGNDVVFGSSNPSLSLVAHEVAHTFQQGGSGLKKYAKVGARGDSYEQQADQAAASVMAGQKVDVGALSGNGAPQIQRAEPGTAAQPAPAAAPSGPWTAPPEIPPRMPADGQVITIGTQGLYQAMVNAVPYAVPLEDRTWGGYALFSRMSSEDFVKNNLTNMCNGGGVEEILDSYTTAVSVFTGSIQVKARVTSVTFDSADGVGVTEGGSGGPGTSGGGSYGTSASVTGSAGAKAGDAKAGGEVSGQVGGTAGDQTSRTSGGSWAGGSTRGAGATGGVRFAFNVAFDVSIHMDHEPRTWSAIVTLGTGYLAAGGNNSRTARAQESGRVRFRQERCTPPGGPTR
jgi:hypothetical protein